MTKRENLKETYQCWLVGINLNNLSSSIIENIVSANWVWGKNNIVECEWNIFLCMTCPDKVRIMMELSDFENILFKNIFHFIREGSKYSQKFKSDPPPPSN